MRESIAERLRSAITELPRAERAAARTLLAEYPGAGLQSVARFAAQASVSAPTVLRLTDRLGYGSYADFQQALRDELQYRLTSPLKQYATTEDLANPLQRARQVFAQCVDDTFDLIVPAEFELAVDLLVAPRNRIYTTGGRFSSLMARSLALHLEILRPGVMYLRADDRPTMLTDCGKRDVVFVADLRRYQSDTIAFGNAAAGRGARLILLTDRWFSPLAACAEVVLQAAIDAPPFDSLVGANCVVETLVGGVVDRLGSTPTTRIKRYDEAWNTPGISSAIIDESGTTPVTGTPE